MGRSLRDQFASVLANCCLEHYRDGIAVREYSHDWDPSAHTLQYISFQAHPNAKQRIISLYSPGTRDPFTEDKRFLRHSKFYGISAKLEGGETVIGLRTIEAKQKPNHGKNYIRAAYDRTFNVYQDVQEDPFLFDWSLDCIIYKDFVFIRNRKKFQRIFNFEEIVREAAEYALRNIRQHIAIKNHDDFEKSCKGDLTKMERLASIANMADFSQLDVDAAREVAKSNSEFLEIIHQDEDGASLIFDPRRPWNLLRFFSESTVRSVATGNIFEADHNKRPVYGDV